jgi:hypothetical protein
MHLFNMAIWYKLKALQPTICVILNVGTNVFKKLTI